MMATKGRDRLARQRGDSSLLRTFQTQLEVLRKETGLSRRAFADRLGIPRSSYFHLMSEAANPSLETIELIAERAGVAPLALFPPSSGSGGQCHANGIGQ